MAKEDAAADGACASHQINPICYKFLVSIMIVIVIHMALWVMRPHVNVLALPDRYSTPLRLHRKVHESSTITEKS
ncbi:hypothetical protein CRG98_035934 [Punica granatum]|uniref:Uncharacterized protein n=1 Tax=Punica granatum TaxID=22663 RepID=A0A2I0II56_PUNGR|nr:hypothetical protein CRG98_035934 [Punica granatum]